MAKIIQYKWTLILNLEAINPISQMYKTSKMNIYKYIHLLISFEKCHFLHHSESTKCTWKFFKIFAAWLCLQTGRTLQSAMKKISWILNSLKDNFGEKSLSLSTKRKLSIVLIFPFPYLSFSGVFLTLKCETLVSMSCLTSSLGPCDPMHQEPGPTGVDQGQSLAQKPRSAWP